MVQKIYDISPIWFQNLIVASAGYKKSLGRYGDEYIKSKKFLRDFDTWTLERKAEYQITEVKRMLHFVDENCPFYSELYKDIDLSAITTIRDLQKLPIITKEMLRLNIDRIDTTNKKGLQGHTGGTTGKSLVVYYTKDNAMQRMAMLDHFKERVGFVHRKMKRATFNGKHIVPPAQSSKVFWRYNPSCKQMMYSSFHISEENCKHYVDGLNAFKPDAIDGFFMSIYDIANYIDRHKVQLTFKPVAIFPTSETLNDHGRLLIEKVFGCKVYDQYASSEGAPFITECINQTPHIEMASGIFENESDKSDEVLVTSFTTYGTPLIRYKIGDKVKFDKSGTFCECRMKSIQVTEIQGRKMDFLYALDGSKINGGNVANLFKNLPNVVVKAQLVQDVIDEIKVNLVVDKNTYKEKHLELLREEFTHKFGPQSKLVINLVNDIPRESSGKFRFIINNVLIK